jgi:Transposase, Mutator family
LLTFFTFPKAQWKTLRTTNTIERLHEEFRRPLKTQGSLPNEDAAVVLLFSLVASGQIKLRRIDGWRKIARHAKPACWGGGMTISWRRSQPDGANADEEPVARHRKRRRAL